MVPQHPTAPGSNPKTLSQQCPCRADWKWLHPGQSSSFILLL